MNTGKRRRAIAAYCCAAVLVSGCAAPSGGQSPQGFTSLPSTASSAASVTRVAGRYHGKFLLKAKPVGDVYFNLTQTGTAVGGSLRLVLAKATILEPVALTLDAANNALTGNAIDPTGKTPCAYTISGSYNPKTFVLRATSSPLTCPGKVANFSAVESCYYNAGSSTSIRRPQARGLIEC